MDLLLVSVVAVIAIISVSIVTVNTVGKILSDDVNLANKLTVIQSEDY